MTTMIRRLLLLASLPALVACSEKGAETGADPYAAEHAAAPTNRVDIPDSVRRNLGVTFAKVECRNVARTLRVPGRFEPLPTAHREYRAPLAGRVELLVTQYQRVTAGTPLYRIDAPAWRALEEDIVATEAKVASMPPLREAHRVHENALAEKVELWRERLKQLDELQNGRRRKRARRSMEARATLTATRAELADVMEKDATLEAERRAREGRPARARRAARVDRAACGDGKPQGSGSTEPGLLVARLPTAWSKTLA
jgi:multidrug efflux pump subunit AcrA (membrane-fusion protein)